MSQSESTFFFQSDCVKQHKQIEQDRGGQIQTFKARLIVSAIQASNS